MADRYECLIAWTRTGEVVDRLAMKEWSWDDSVYWTDPGKCSITVPLNKIGPNPNRTTLDALRREGARQTLALVRVSDTEGPRVMHAGPCFNPPAWSTTEATVSAGSMVKLFDERIVADAAYLLDPGNSAADIHLQLLPRDRLIRLLQLAMTGPPSLARDLPITLPPLSGLSSSTDAVDYVATELGSCSERVRAITDQDNGPDVHITASVTSDLKQLSWSVEVGDPYLGAVWPDTFPTWTYGVGIRTLTGDTDDSEGATTVFVPGSGSGDDRLIGVSSKDLSGDPYAIGRERVDRAISNQVRLSDLNARATARRASRSAPLQAWKVSVHDEHVPRLLTGWRLGDTVRLAVKDHAVIPNGDYLQRVVGASARRGQLDLTLVDQPPRPTSGVAA